MARYGPAELRSVCELLDAGVAERKIAKLTGVGRGTVNAWRHGRGIVNLVRLEQAQPGWRPADARAYCYEYPRYFFSNLSKDIRRIFCDHCDLLGIRWTQPNARNISVSHRRSVALLDDFVGPKR
jgi:hypothetical protein